MASHHQPYRERPVNLPAQQAAALYWRLLNALVARELAEPAAASRMPLLLASRTFHTSLLALAAQLVIAAYRMVRAAPHRSPASSSTPAG